MEYAEGGTMADLIRRNRTGRSCIPEEAIWRCLVQATRANIDDQARRKQCALVATRAPARPWLRGAADHDSPTRPGARARVRVRVYVCVRA